MLYNPRSAVKPDLPVPSDYGQECVPLEELARRIRDGHQAIHQAIQAARGLTLDQAMDVGDAALVVKARVPSLKGWLIENRIVVSTTLLYAQLAAHRTKIEITRKGNPDFSLRDARRLITKKRPPKPAGNKGSAAKETSAAADAAAVEAEDEALDPAVMRVLAALRALSDTQASEVFNSYTLEATFRVIPRASWRLELARHIFGLPSKDGLVLLRESEVLRKALSLVRIAAKPETMSPNTAAYEREALAALRALTAAIGDIDTDSVTIICKHAKENRCCAKKGRRSAT